MTNCRYVIKMAKNTRTFRCNLIRGVIQSHLWQWLDLFSSSSFKHYNSCQLVFYPGCFSTLGTFCCFINRLQNGNCLYKKKTPNKVSHSFMQIYHKFNTKTCQQGQPCSTVVWNNCINYGVKEVSYHNLKTNFYLLQQTNFKSYIVFPWFCINSKLS